MAETLEHARRELRRERNNAKRINLLVLSLVEEEAERNENNEHDSDADVDDVPENINTKTATAASAVGNIIGHGKNRNDCQPNAANLHTKTRCHTSKGIERNSQVRIGVKADGNMVH